MSKHKHNAKRPLSRAAKYELIDLAGTRCMYCGEDVGDEITWHHIRPRSEGGEDTFANSSLLCKKCHQFTHTFMSDSTEYRFITSVILQNKAKFLREKTENARKKRG